VIAKAALVPSAGITLNFPDVLFLLEPPPEWCFPVHVSYPATSGRKIVKTYSTVTLAMLTGFGLGVVAVQGLHAQAKPPVYYISVIDVSDPDAYGKEYAPKAQATIKAAGGRFVAIGGTAGVGAGKVTAFDGEAPKRVTVQVWDSMEKINAWRADPAYIAIRKIGDKYAKFHSFAVDGVPQ
jgi:uncharacterized protein (DUF1330 family)